MADGADGALLTVRTIVAAKIANSRVVLLRAAREVADKARKTPSARLRTGSPGLALKPRALRPSMRRVAMKGLLARPTFRYSTT